MKLEFIKVGKPGISESSSWVETYTKRSKRYVPFEARIIKENQLVNVVEKCHSSAHKLVLLDEGGEQFSSRQLSQLFKRWIDEPTIKSATFIVGSPYGFTNEAKNAADALWSLAKGTFPSDLAWVMTAEQIYRALSIINGSDYHHE